MTQFFAYHNETPVKVTDIVTLFLMEAAHIPYKVSKRLVTFDHDEDADVLRDAIQRGYIHPQFWRCGQDRPTLSIPCVASRGVPLAPSMPTSFRYWSEWEIHHQLSNNRSVPQARTNLVNTMSQLKRELYRRKHPDVAYTVTDGGDIVFTNDEDECHFLLSQPA